MIKVSKWIKSALFILFFLKYLTHDSSLSTNEHIQKKFTRGFDAYINNTLYFSSHQMIVFKIYDFSHVNWYFEGSIYM